MKEKKKAQLEYLEKTSSTVSLNADSISLFLSAHQFKDLKLGLTFTIINIDNMLSLPSEIKNILSLPIEINNIFCPSNKILTTSCHYQVEKKMSYLKPNWISLLLHSSDTTNICKPSQG